jgi:hypothetical protein
MKTGPAAAAKVMQSTEMKTWRETGAEAGMKGSDESWYNLK